VFTLIVAVGSSNPVKVKAVERAFAQFYKVTVLMVNVPSEVPPQPVGLDMTIKGAISRARNAITASKEAEFGVGLEAGLLHVPSTLSGYMDQQFAAIVDRNGRVTLGGGPSFEYPSAIVSRVLGEGIEVGTAMDQLTGVEELGQKQGAIGYFSKGRLDRTSLTEQAVLMALLPRVNQGLYFR
jgi:inosine/xanthosine triphosphatase